ncbi:hypothetical protein [Weissella paramesenteroides]|uniref:hypothetical protein n=1 Tax=Weissella paramesenteroides TaxID=1249 RepID=UPI00103D7E9D|nr:hypothetical protein [Weissella paramesenteroides]RZQ58386.1 hypothetical protein EWR19_04660 [Weissella paramesenteroides]
MIFLHRAFQTVFSIILIGFAVSLLSSIGFAGLLSTTLCLILAIVLFIKYKQSNQFKEKITQLFGKHQFLKIAIIINLVINLLLLLYVAMNFQINDLSDPLNVQIKATELLQNNLNWHTNEEYFYFYPNTVFFTILLSKVMKFGLFFHISIQLTIRLFSVILLFGISVFSLLTIWTLTKKIRHVFGGSVLLLILPVMYFYPNLVTYTDTLTMFLTTIILFFIAEVFTTKSKLKVTFSSLFIILLYSILFLVKANLIILIPASLAVAIIALVKRSTLTLRSLLVLMTLIFGLGAAVVVQKPIEQHYGFNYNTKKQMGLPVTHWINMGLNTNPLNAKGTYSLVDDNFARQSKIDNHTSYITDSIKNRIQALGITGLFTQITDKTKTLLGDPLFGYGRYQAGFAKVPNQFIRNESRYHMLMNLISAFVIILTIIRLLFVLFKKDTFEKTSENTQLFFYLVGISSVGLILFHTVVWEVEPRYFLPLLYPLLISSYLLPFDNIAISKNLRISKTFITILSVLTVSVFGLTVMSNKIPMMMSGNMEYPARIAITKSMPLSKTMSFKIPVNHDSDTIKINLPVNSKIKIETSDKQEFINEGGKYALHGVFKKGQKVVINLSPVNKADKKEMIWLYQQPTLYKTLFHGSPIHIDNHDYYLQYEMDHSY